MTAPVPDPEPVGSPSFRAAVRDGRVPPGLTLDEWPAFDLFESDAEADEFLDWLYRFRREGVT